MILRPETTVLFLILTLVSGCASTSPHAQHENAIPLTLSQLGITETNLTPDQWAIQKIAQAKMDGRIVSYLKRHPTQNEADEKLADKIVQLNVLGFLYQPDYTKHDTPEAQAKIKNFLKKYRKTFVVAEKQFQVSKEAIVSLLWVETKLGFNTGKFPLMSVYGQLLKADHPLLIQHSLVELLKKRPDADAALQKKCVDRSVSKAKWAMEQMIAIDTILKRKNQLSSKWILNTKASYAGALGLPQFIPSSYLQFAVSAQGQKNIAHLQDPRDAILSVANFLHIKGWNEQDEAQKVKALYDYNRSKDYGAIILKIAAQVAQK